jgi:hypothetical protein
VSAIERDESVVPKFLPEGQVDDGASGGVEFHDRHAKEAVVELMHDDAILGGEFGSKSRIYGSCRVLMPCPCHLSRRRARGDRCGRGLPARAMGLKMLLT